MIEFFNKVVKFLTDLGNTILGTTVRINSFNFEDSVFLDYLGYAKYAMGTPLYTLFTSVVLIGIGFAIFTYAVKGIAYIRGIM